MGVRVLKFLDDAGDRDLGLVVEHDSRVVSEARGRNDGEAEQHACQDLDHAKSPQNQSSSDSVNVKSEKSDVPSSLTMTSLFWFSLKCQYLMRRYASSLVSFL